VDREQLAGLEVDKLVVPQLAWMGKGEESIDTTAFTLQRLKYSIDASGSTKAQYC
jgi:hypothetical protein